MMRRFAVALGLLPVLVCAGEPAFSPVLNWQGLKGLSQVQAAEALGEGRLSVMLHGSGFLQDQDLNALNNAVAPSSVGKNALVATYQGSLSYGLNSAADLYASALVYSVQKDDKLQNPKGLGTVAVGMKLSIPFEQEFPLRLGVMGQFSRGFAGNQLIVDREKGASGSLRPDGYNFYETRTGYDFMAMSLESFVFGNDDIKVRFHFNEGLATTLDSASKPIGVLAGGLEIAPGRYLSLALEGNWRSWALVPSESDPIWITPSLHIKTPVGFSIHGGADLAVMKNRSTRDEGTPVKAVEQPNALAPWRVFGGFSASFDVFAANRLRARKKAAEDSLERERLRELTRSLADSKRALGEKAHQDSLDQANAIARQDEAMRLKQKEMSDSLSRRELEMQEKIKQLQAKEAALAAEELERRRQMGISDSIRAKRIQDSIAMASALDAEKSRRSGLERDLLKTGVANLESVYFDNGKTSLAINSKPYLQMVGQILAKYPKLKIEVGGHTDNKGKKAANQKLSAGRADAVKSFMVEAAPELKGVLSSKGYGDSKPKAPNKTEAGRLQNRRVELKVLNPEVLKEYSGK
jgi:outer membrane protein OmpA-like peptidoglycan-associated protein